MRQDVPVGRSRPRPLGACPTCRHKFRVPEATAASDATRGPTLPETLPTTPPQRQPAASTRATLPERLGRFLIKERLGAGAFAAVYRAHDPQLGREVALKVPHPGSLSEPHLTERFLREGRAAAGLHHPHIVPVFDAGHDGPHHYLAATFIQGRSLAHEVAEGPLDCRRAAEMVRQLAEALAYAHARGVIHRDVKPANVLLDEQGEAHLTDFGLAHRADEGAEALTREGAVLGTPAYMAPEQAAGQHGEPLPASDQYSLGAVLYELLTGEAPFSGPPAIVLYNVIHREPESPRQLNPAVPPELEAVCLKALAKRPEGRYAGCAELAADLRRWLEGAPVGARPLGMAARTLRWLRRTRLAALAALTVVCLLAAAVLATGKARQFDTQKEKTAELKRKAAAEEQQASELAQAANERKQEAKRLAREATDREDKAKQRKEEAQQAAARQKKSAADILKAEQDASKQERAARQLLYNTHLAIAQRALDRGDLDRTHALLARYLPEPSGEDLRSADWKNLWEQVFRERTVWVRAARITYIVLSPDGKLVASGSEEYEAKTRKAWGEVRVWNTATGQKTLTLKGPTEILTSRDVFKGVVCCVAFSPDGERLASASMDGTLTVWDASTGGKIRTLKGGTSVCFSPDGKRIASASWDLFGHKLGEVKVWDARTGRETLSLKGHTGGVLSVCFSPDGKRLASGSVDKTVKVWDAATGRRPSPSRDTPRASAVWSSALTANGSPRPATTRW